MERSRKEEKIEGVRGEGEEGEEDHSERSCFYSLSFLAEAKDMLSTDEMLCLLGQRASHCLLLYCIVLYVMCGSLYITILLLSVRSHQKNIQI